MSSASSTYPPAPQRRPSPPLSPSSSRSGSPPGATLYGRSPHRHRDTLFRRRRERFNCGLDPLHVVALIVLAGILLASRPELLSPDTYLRPFSTRPSPTLRPCDLPSQRNGKRAKCDCSHCSQDTIMVWQKTFTLPSASKGCHLVTPAVEREISDGVKGVKAGLITLFIQHTSAALSVNENYDSTVRTDMNMAMDRIVPESLPWKHTDEGPDDSASHTKASLFGSSITIPITDGRLNLGTWQGIYLCEFRAMKHSRRVVATVLP